MYPYFDLSRLRLSPLAERDNDLRRGFIRDLRLVSAPVQTELADFASSLSQARKNGAARMWIMGAHVLRSGLQRYLFSLMEEGYVSIVALNGAGAIHDFELAMQGETTESVARYISNGKFGLWRETGRINDIVAEGWEHGLGFGEALGKAIYDGDLPFKKDSIFAKGYELGIPVTVHVGIGYDIIHAHPNFNGAATGAASHRDFLIFANALESLDGGCVATFGSAVMGPEVFLKALSMVRNAAGIEGRKIDNFMSLVCDLHSLPENPMQEASKDDARYYFRPWKTLLSRTVSQGGQSRYVQGRHETTIPAIWTALRTIDSAS